MAFEQFRDAAGIFNDLKAANNLAHGVRDGFAVLDGDHLGELAVIGFDQFPELEHDAGPAQRGYLTPFQIGVMGDLNRLIDLGFGGQINLCDRFADGRIEHILLAAGCSGNHFAINPVTYCA